MEIILTLILICYKNTKFKIKIKVFFIKIKIKISLFKNFGYSITILLDFKLERFFAVKDSIFKQINLVDII